MTEATKAPAGLKAVPFKPGTFHYDARATAGLPARVLTTERQTKGHSFIAGGRKAHIDHDEDGYTEWGNMNALVKLADGTVLNGLITLCVTDSCEHYGTVVWVREDRADGAVITHLADLSDESECEAVGLPRERIFGAEVGTLRCKGYRYNYITQIGDRGWGDHHVGENGWS